MTCLTGCCEEDSLELSTNSLDFQFAGETKSFVIDSNTGWKVSSDASSWLTITPSSGSDNGTVTVTATANSLTKQRTALITVSGGKINQTISVTQGGFVASLDVSTKSIEFTSPAGENKVDITSNTNWTIEKSAATTWLTVSPASGTNNGAITVKATANTTTTNRTATITVKAGEASQTISVTQSGAAVTLTVSKSSLSFLASTSLTESFSITSNTDWTISRGGENWFTVTPISGSNNRAISVTATANNTSSGRSGTITVAAGNITRTIIVTQVGAAASLSITANSGSNTPYTEGSFQSVASQGSFYVKSNTNWNVKSSESWIVVSPSSGTNNGTVRFEIGANSAKTSRDATITVSGSGITQTFKVSQYGLDPEIKLSTSSLNFSAASGENTFSFTSNVSWTVSSDANWLTVSPTSGSQSYREITVKAAANTSTSTRKATITVSGGGLSQTISVTQDAVVPFLTVSESSISFPTTADQSTFTISSNISWTVSSSASMWLTVSPSAGSNNGTATVKVTANNATSQREGTITIRGGNIIRMIKVTQPGVSAYLTVSRSYMSLSASGSSSTFSVSSNTNWTARSNATWLTVTPSSGSNNREVTVITTTNNSSSSRTATVTVSGSGITRTIEVYQAGVPASGSIAFWSSRDFGCGYITITITGQGSKTLSTFYVVGSPTCGSSGAATFSDLPVGTYSYSASCSGRKWSGTVTRNESCHLIKLE